MGIITPLGRDEPVPKWATPLVVVKKPDNSVRLCGDFKVTLNPNLVVEEHPLPRIEDLLATVGPAEYYSVVDLSQAYLQMELSKESQDLCYLNTHKGLYKMLRMPYGITDAPSIFQREMDHLMKDIPGVKCLLDDVLIVGRTKEEALSRIDRVFKVIKEAGLRLKKKKCQFLKSEVNYLGYVIGKDGLKTNKEKVAPILGMKSPENVK